MSFQLANLSGQSVPTITERDVKVGEVFNKGALLVVVSGKYQECGADPDVVDAVAESGFGPDTGNFSNRLGTKGFPPGKMQGCEVQPNRRFSCEVKGDQEDIDALVEGQNYGVARDTDGRWKLDPAEGINTVVKLISKSWNSMLQYDVTIESEATSITLGRNRVIVEFLSSSEVGAES